MNIQLNCRKPMIGAFVLSLLAASCASNQREVATELPENSFDENESSAKEAQEVADERREESAVEATHNVEDVEVVKDEVGPTTVDDVDTELE